MKKRNLAIIKEALLEAVKKAGFEIDIDDLHIEKTKEAKHGDFSTNVAMLIAGKAGRKPHEVAEEIVKQSKSDLFEKVEIAGPGFINVWVVQIFYTEECQLLCENIEDYVQQIVGIKQDSKTMVSDTSHPNVAKPMGVHHLLSTIIGDAIIKNYRTLGWKVISDNYIGDWGTQFGKLIYAIKTWGDRKAIKADPIPELLKLYVRFHDEAEKNEELEDFGRAEFKKLEDGDKENRELLNYIVKISLEEFEKIYKRLNVGYDLMNGESFYENKMDGLLTEGRKTGVFVDGNNGAWIVMPDDPNDPPALVKKSDGATLYLTRDLAQMAYWEEEYHPDVMLWVVDVAQSLHFKQRFHASRKLGQTSAKLVHANFGRMQFKDKKMSTRKGNILKLEEVLDEAEERALALAKDRATGFSEAEIKELSRIMGIGSIKYNILSQNRIQNIVFDWDRMLSFEGNSAPYLMYTATRAKSLLKKGEVSTMDASKFDLNFTDALEKEVVLQIMMYPDVLRRAADEFKPNHIANYLYSLAQDFNTMYNALSVLEADSEDHKETRLLLTAAVQRVMEHGLGILGIEVPEKM